MLEFILVLKPTLVSKLIENESKLLLRSFVVVQTLVDRYRSV